MSIEFHCSSCQRLLRVPDDSGGKKAKCPDCGQVVEIPGVSSTGMAPAFPSGAEKIPAANPFAENPYQTPADTSFATPQPGQFGPGDLEMIRAKVSGPAISLIVVAGLALAVLVLNTIVTFVVGVEEVAFGPPPRNEAERIGQQVGAVIGIFVALGIYSVMLYGAIQMKQMKSYAWSMTASILALLPCSVCCLLGLPFGIWSLVTLNDPAVKAAFQRVQ